MGTIHILLVEDNEGDILLTTEALEEGKIPNTISVVKDGKSAIDYLEKNGQYNNSKTPDLILLDINLPKINGHEVLQYIKERKYLKKIPIIILTTSSTESDINLVYQNYANCFISKPAEADNFLDVITSIEDFWFNVVKLPSK